MELQAPELRSEHGVLHESMAPEKWPSEGREASAILNDCRPELELLFHQDLKAKDIIQIMQKRHGIKIT